MRRPRILTEKTGTAAVEFALVAPVLLLFLLTMTAYGVYLAASHAIQQVAADAARSAVAGYNLQEREQLARDYIANSTIDYPMVDPENITVDVVDDPKNPNQFTITVKYNSENLPIWGLYTYMLPGKTITKFSTIRIGGT